MRSSLSNILALMPVGFVEISVARSPLSSSKRDSKAVKLGIRTANESPQKISGSRVLRFVV